VGWEQAATVVVTAVLAVLAGILYNNRRFDDVHRRIDDLRADMNARFAQADGRLAQVEARLAELREDLREIRSLLQDALRTRAVTPLPTPCRRDALACRLPEPQRREKPDGWRGCWSWGRWSTGAASS
jgi:hypothetical protein